MALTDEERYDAIVRLENKEDVAALDIVAGAMVDELFDGGRAMVALNYNSQKVIKQGMKDMAITDPNIIINMILDMYAPHYWKARKAAEAKKV